MRVLHVVPTYLPAWRYGGPIRSVHGLARAQASAGDSVDVFTTDADGGGRLAVPTDRAVDREGVRVHYYACGSPRRIYRSPALGGAVRARLGTFEVVHLHSVFLWPTLVAAREALRRGVPYVVSPRGMLVDDLIAARGGLRKRLWIRLFERRTLGGAGAILTTSDYESAEIRRLGLDLAPLAAVPNGVALDYGEDDAGGGAALSRFVEAGPFFLFLGRLAAKKSLDLLLEALALAPGSRLVLAGNDDEGLGGKLAERTAALGLAGRVHFAGEVRGATKRELLRECRGLVLPSLSENLGNVVLEALASGRPVVVTATVGLAAEVERRRAGLVSEPSPRGLAIALGQLESEPEAADAMGAAGRAWVEAELSWEAVARQVRSVYEQAATARREG